MECGQVVGDMRGAGTSASEHLGRCSRLYTNWVLSPDSSATVEN